MKKDFTFLMVLVCLIVNGINLQGQDLKTAEIKKAEFAPVIDGDPIEWANVLSTYHEIKTITTGDNTKSLEDTYGIWQAVWNDTALFVYVSVYDDDLQLSPITRDILEFYVDMDNNKTEGGLGEAPSENGPKFGPATQYIMIWGDTIDFHANGSELIEGTDSAVVWAVKVKPDSLGYHFEACFPFGSLKEGFEPEIGKTISWDVNIADIDEGDDVKTDQYWNNWEKGLWKSMANSGDLTLVAGPAGIIAPTSAHTNDFSRLKVYPNPVTDMLMISNQDGIVSVEIVNVLGKNTGRYSLKAERNASINVSELKSGVYFLNITDVNGNIHSKRIIKK